MDSRLRGNDGESQVAWVTCYLRGAMDHIQRELRFTTLLTYLNPAM